MMIMVYIPMQHYQKWDATQLCIANIFIQIHLYSICYLVHICSMHFPFATQPLIFFYSTYPNSVFISIQLYSYYERKNQRKKVYYVCITIHYYGHPAPRSASPLATILNPSYTGRTSNPQPPPLGAFLSHPPYNPP